MRMSAGYTGCSRSGVIAAIKMFKQDIVSLVNVE